MKKTMIDHVLEVVSILSVFLSFIIIVCHWNKFPIKIPLNNGTTATKWVLLILPIISLISYVGMTILNRFPHNFNYPIKVTEQNAEKLYSIAIKTVSFIKMLICLMILYAVISIVSSLVHSKSIFNLAVFFIFIIGILVATVITIVNMFRVKA